MTAKERLEKTKQDPAYIAQKQKQAETKKLDGIADELQSICDSLNAFREKYGKDAAIMKIGRHSPIAQEPHQGSNPNRFYVVKPEIKGYLKDRF